MSNLVVKYGDGTVDSLDYGDPRMIEWIVMTAAWKGGITEVVRTRSGIELNPDELQKFDFCPN